MRWIRFAAAVFAIFLVSAAKAAGVPSGFIIITLADRIALMNSLDPVSARAYFDRNSSYGLIMHGDRATLEAARQLKAQGWHFQLAEDYFDFSAFRADVAAHAIEPGVTAVVYDNEKGATREAESGDGGFDDPTSRRTATRNFYTLAKANGLTVILAPGTVCAAGRILPRGRLTPKTCYSYLSEIAPYADIIDPQFQGLIRDPGAHLAATRNSAALMRSANPSIKILSQFTTSVVHHHYTPAQNIVAMRAALPFVDGLWANLPPTPQGVRQGIEVWKAVH